MKNKKQEKSETAAEDVMSDQEKAIRRFFDWIMAGLRMPDIELAYESRQDVEVPATVVRPEVRDAIDNLMNALIHYRELDRQMIRKQLARREVVNIQDWEMTHVRSLLKRG